MDFVDGKWTLVQWIVVHCQATRHYPKMCRSKSPMPYGAAIPRLVKLEHAKLRLVPPTYCHENAWKLHIWPVSLSQIGAKMRNINRPWPKSNPFWKWSEYINMPNLRPFLFVFKWKCPELQTWPVSLSQNATKMRNITRRWPKSDQFSRWSGYINNFRPFTVTVIKTNVRNQHYLWCHHKH